MLPPGSASEVRAAARRAPIKGQGRLLMKFQISAFGHAASDIGGESASSQWHANVCALPGAPTREVTAEEAGTALVASLSAVPDPAVAIATAEALYLKNVLITGPAGSYLLDSADALSHPLLKEWIGGTAGDAVGKALWAGATHQQLALGAPYFEHFEVVNYHQVGQVGARLELTFTQPNQILRALAHFGSYVDNASLCCTNRISGDALVTIGRTAHASRNVVTAALDAASAPPPAPPSAGPLLH